MKSKKNFSVIAITLGFLFILNFLGYSNNYTYQREKITDQKFQEDSVFIEYSGKIYDNQTKKAISFASIIIKKTNTGTVANSEGEFLIKIPKAFDNAALEISSLGYKTLSIPVVNLKSTENEFFLEPTAYSLAEVEIRKIDPLNLIRDVLRNIPRNYGDDPSMFTAFYRETIKQNRNYVAVSEAVFDVYKSGYGKVFDNDRIKIFKGRKSQDVSRMDTVLFKLQGGPYYIFLLDIARHPGDLLSGDVLDYYNFELGGIVSIDDRNAYVVTFNQKNSVTLPLYKGNIYVDVETKAIIAVEFTISEVAIDKAAEFMIIKKPANMKVDVMSALYRVNYRFTGNTWVLNYARSEVHFRCRWDKKLFRSNYYTMSEMAITDIDKNNIIKFKTRETSRPDEILVEKIADFEDPEFWGDYNIIRPEQTIEQAIEKLGRRLKRLEMD